MQEQALRRRLDESYVTSRQTGRGVATANSALQGRGLMKSYKYPAYSKAYRKRNRKKYRDYARKRYAQHPELVKAQLKKSRKSFPERHLLNTARCRAKKVGLVFDLVIEDIQIPEVCPYLGIPLSVYVEKDYCPSMDRIDNTK